MGVGHDRALKIGVVALAGLVCVTACSRPERMAEAQPVRIVAGAWSGEAESRVMYDGDRGRVSWTKTDRLAVAACEAGGRVSDGGVRWRCFLQSEAYPFDPDYLLFEGEALGTPGSRQALYAFYPYDLLTAPDEDAFRFPAGQQWVAGSFDPAAVVMCSAPVMAELPESGTLHTSAFRFRHHTGYLRLLFEGLPAEAADEQVVAVELAAAGQPVAGVYHLAIDDEAGTWSMTPGAETTDRLTVDFSAARLTVGELTECWFAMMPATYETVILTIRTASGGTLTMERGGLPIRSGVVKVQTLRFRDGDRYDPVQVMAVDAGTLTTGTVYGSGSAELDGVTLCYERLRQVPDGEETWLDLATRTGTLYNTTPVPGAIQRIEVDFATALGARYTTVTIGATPEGGTSAGGASEGVNTFEAGDAEARYFRIAHTGILQSARIRSIRIWYR